MPIVPGTNPALQTWNGQNFVVADGSAQNRISLPFLQIGNGTASYIVGADNNGTLSYYNPLVVSATNLFGGTTGSLPYQSAANTTTFLPIGTAGQVLKVSNTGLPQWTTPLAPTAQNISGGAAGSVVYQTAPSTTGFTSVGTTGNVLTSGGTGSPTWTSATDVNTSSAIVKRDVAGNFSAGTITASLSGNATTATTATTANTATSATTATTATTATNIAGGAAGSVPYQTAAGTTSLLAGTSATIPNILMSCSTVNGGLPYWGTGNGTTPVNQQITAQKAVLLSGGATGSIPYQTGSGVTSFLGIGTANQLLTVNTSATAPTWQTGIKGVTDGSNASAGFVGEWIVSNIASGSAITLTNSGTVYTITSINLTAGDWNVSACVNIHLSSTTMTSARGGISTSNIALTAPTTATTGVFSNSYDTFASLISTSNASSQSTTLGVGGDLLLTTKTSRVNLNGAVTIYLVATAAFTGTAPTAYGAIEARRVR